MRRWMEHAPWWQLGLALAVPWAVAVFAAFTIAEPDGPVLPRLVGVTVGAVLFGLVVGATLARIRRRGRDRT